MFGWGSASNGQLGLGDIKETVVSSPRVINVKNRTIDVISCGLCHTMFLTRGRLLYSFGSNVFGQLGHQKHNTTPELIDTLETEETHCIASGDNFNVISTVSGKVFGWGENDSSQLTGSVTDPVMLPRFIGAFSGLQIVQLSCGSKHVLALSKCGSVFSWGSNSAGQIGLKSETPVVSKPYLIKEFYKFPIRQVSAGGNHSIVLTDVGSVFGFGKNSQGQLGLGDVLNRCLPTPCASLYNVFVRHASCGMEHTVVLTDDGTVFVFGAGNFGQLGHRSFDNLLKPTPLKYLKLLKITQVHCGYYHTVLVANGKIYTFGSNSFGQLGVRASENSNVAIELPKLNQNLVPYKLFTGGNHIIALMSDPKYIVDLPNPDMKATHSQFQPYYLTTELLSLLHNLSRDNALEFEDLQLFKHVFSNSMALNKSFFSKTGRDIKVSPCIDFELIFTLSDKLISVANSSIDTAMANSLEILLKSLPTQPYENSLRCYLVIPFLHILDDPRYFQNIIVPFGRYLNALPQNSLDILYCWYQTIDNKYFSKLITIYKEVIRYILNLGQTSTVKDRHERCDAILSCLVVLEKLNHVNELTDNTKVPYLKFYLPELVSKIDLPKDFIFWLQKTLPGIPVRPMRSENGFSEPLCKFPFVLNASAKNELVSFDAKLQMHFAMKEVALNNVAFFFNSNILVSDRPFLFLQVDRNQLISSTISQLICCKDKDFKKPLKVSFKGEEAIDAGGITKEFFMLIMKEIVNPNYGMFRYFEESQTLWFNEKSFEDNSTYEMIGSLCGLAIYNSTIVDLPFPIVLYKKLLHQKLRLSDVNSLSPSMYRSLEDLLAYEGDDFNETFYLAFEYASDNFGEVTLNELKEGGSKIDVTMDNRREYVELYIDYIFNKSCSVPFEAFRHGFSRVFDSKVFTLLRAEELMSLVVGNENYDFIELQHESRYKGVFYAEHKTIKYFWEVLHDLDVEKKKDFLKWLTGTDRIPVMGMKSLQVVIQSTAGGEQYLPVAHTCFGIIDLPVYSTKEILRAKLLLAILHKEGFLLV